MPEMTKNSHHVTGFVDCVSLPCPSIFTSVIEKIDQVNPGSIIEVICDDRVEAGSLLDKIPSIGHKVLGVDEDAQRNIRILIEKIY